jgi:hypothetical protein
LQRCGYGTQTLGAHKFIGAGASSQCGSGCHLINELVRKILTIGKFSIQYLQQIYFNEMRYEKSFVTVFVNFKLYYLTVCWPESNYFLFKIGASSRATVAWYTVKNQTTNLIALFHIWRTAKTSYLWMKDFLTFWDFKI